MENAALSRDAATVRLDALLFGETQSRVVITCKPLDAVKVVERAKLMGVPAMQIGKVGGDKLTVKTAQRRILRPAHRTARRVVELHRPRDGVNFILNEISRFRRSIFLEIQS